MCIRSLEKLTDRDPAQLLCGHVGESRSRLGERRPDSVDDCNAQLFPLSCIHQHAFHRSSMQKGHARSRVLRPRSARGRGQRLPPGCTRGTRVALLDPKNDLDDFVRYGEPSRFADRGGSIAPTASRDVPITGSSLVLSYRQNKACGKVSTVAECSHPVSVL